ncbi:MAG TPA: glycosyltransferase family A protein [Candidatus Microsaccharimonas sp.]
MSKILGVDLSLLQSNIHDMHSKMDAFTPEVLARLRDIEIKTHHIEDRLTKQDALLKSERDNIPVLRNRLFDVRKTKEYIEVFSDKNPLITVRIATYNRADILIERAIKSVLSQTYQNFEIIVVGDGCTDDTEKKIADLDDRRIKFINLPNRSLYPEDKWKRWLVAGSPGMNMGADLARGKWIAPLDDDDVFSEDHLEVLLKLALENKSELVYGALEQVNAVDNSTARIWSNPPIYSQFSFQGAMYLRLLNFFQYDQESWLVEEPGDWNLCRRMLLSGVYYSATEQVVGSMNMIPHDIK